MTCTCHDPVVFGHWCAQPWTTQTPTYGTGQTFTLGTSMSDVEAAFTRLASTVELLNVSWNAINWEELTRSPRFHIKPRKTGEN